MKIPVSTSLTAALLAITVSAMQLAAQDEEPRRTRARLDTGPGLPPWWSESSRGP